MKKIIEYDGTNEAITPVEAEQATQGFRLTEVMNISSGNFLVFDNTPIEVIQQQVTAQVVEDIKSAMESIQLKLDAITIEPS